MYVGNNNNKDNREEQCIEKKKTRDKENCYKTITTTTNPNLLGLLSFSLQGEQEQRTGDENGKEKIIDLYKCAAMLFLPSGTARASLLPNRERSFY